MASCPPIKQPKELLKGLLLHLAGQIAAHSVQARGFVASVGVARSLAQSRCGNKAEDGRFFPNPSPADAYRRGPRARGFFDELAS
jgi:hypothetical protein